MVPGLKLLQVKSSKNKKLLFTIDFLYKPVSFSFFVAFFVLAFLSSFLLVFLVFFFYTVFVFGTFWYSFLPILRFSFLVYGIFTKKSSLKHINMRFSFDHADAKYAMLKMIWYKHTFEKIKHLE